MPLTLTNDQTGLVSREVTAASREIGTLGESMVSGDNKNIEVVDAFLGNSLRDREFFLGAIAQSTSYSTSVVNITENYLDSISSFLQKGIITIATVGVLSDDKVAVLQKHIDAVRTQIDILISSARFDGKDLLGGGVTELNVQVGVDASSTQKISIRNISNNRIYRTSLAHAVNQWLAQDFNRSDHYRLAAQPQAALDAAISDNRNLIGDSATNPVPALITEQQIGNALVAVRNINPKVFSDGLELLIPEFANYLRVQTGATLSTATANDIRNTIDPLVNVANGLNAQIALFAMFQDVAATSLATVKDRAVALDVFQSALTNIRGEQARLRTQKTNLFEAIDALRATVNVTEKTANSYTKTDYVLTAQEYSELIRQIVASVTALQAANKIPEAAQRLIDSLAR